jgi:hypothetical protein
MSLQDTFYTLGIIFMSVSLLILVGIAVLLFYIRGKVAAIHAEIEAKIKDVNDYAVRPVKKIVDMAGAFMARNSGKSKGNKRK